MKSLGYSSSWPTTCFINGGCGARVFAHTNGQGDFVLFDELGWPWPVHDCYLNRYCSSPVDRAPRDGSSVQSVGLASILNIAKNSSDYARESREALRAGGAATRPRNDIRRIEPHHGMSGDAFTVVGFVADIHERYRPRELRSLGTLGEQIATKVIGARNSQITIVNSSLESFTALADLSRQVVAKGDSVSADLRFSAVLRLPLFLCDRVQRLSVRRVSLSRHYTQP